MQFLRPLRQETSRFVKTFFQENPNLMKRYVNTGLTVLGLLLSPVDAFMRHLLTVQGLDPNTQPGLRAQQELQRSMDSLFHRVHEKEYESDFDLNWAMKRFAETRKILEGRPINEKQFKEFTDISKLDCNDVVVPEVLVPELFVVAANPDIVPAMQATLAPAVTVAGDDLDNPRLSRDRKKVELKKYSDLQETEVGGSAIDSLRKALEDISLALDNDVKTTGVKTAKNKKLNRSIPLKSSFKKQIQEKHMRATSLANDMVARGLLENNPKAIQEQIQEILNWGDESFDALKRVVQRHDILPKDLPTIITNEWPAKTTRSISKRKAKK